jgi:hypothetical protein
MMGGPASGPKRNQEIEDLSSEYQQMSIEGPGGPVEAGAVG